MHVRELKRCAMGVLLAGAVIGGPGLGCSDGGAKPGGTAGKGGGGSAGGSAGGTTGAAGSGGSGGAGQGGSAGQPAGGSSGSNDAGGGSGGGGAQGTDARDGGAGDGGARDGADPDAGEWKSLFNGVNLDGWTAAKGSGSGLPVGQIFTVVDGAIHTYTGAADGSAQPIASLRTGGTYSSFVLQLEYKWGTGRYGERSASLRDAGVMFHAFGDLNLVFPNCIEYQIGESPLGGEWIAGDIWVLGSPTRAETTQKNNVFTEPAMGGTKVALGASNARAATGVFAANNQGWNQVELTVHADKDAEYKLNGMVVNRVLNMQFNEGGTWKPLMRGAIMVQAEYAEVSYRNIRIKELP